MRFNYNCRASYNASLSYQEVNLTSFLWICKPAIDEKIKAMLIYVAQYNNFPYISTHQSVNITSVVLLSVRVHVTGFYLIS